MKRDARKPPPTGRELLRDEIYLSGIQHQHGSYRIHLVYPNTYHVGMSNLGYQTVLGLFSCQPGVTVERCFLSEGDRPVTLESGRDLFDCDLLCASLSFEGDYLNFLEMLRKGDLLFENAARRGQAQSEGRRAVPLLLAGGTAVTMNPEPLADFLDIVALGEAEELIPELVATLISARDLGIERGELLLKLSGLQGIYIPALFEPCYGSDQTLLRFVGPAARARRRIVADLSASPTCSLILSPHTEFRSMFLTETGRGCEMGCRFCAAGYIYRPVRKRSHEVVSQSVKEGMQHTAVVGFVGAAVSSHRAITGLIDQVTSSGGRASLSSLMSQKVSEALSVSLGASGQKSVALAPEAATERLRSAIGKRVSNAQILSAAASLSRAGIRNFKLYFMVGLPTETREDVAAVSELVAAVRSATALEGKGSMAAIEVSLSPFVPKAWTPFQWEPVMQKKELQWRVDHVRRSVRQIPYADVSFESVRETCLQALLSRGDRRVGKLLSAACVQGRDWKWIVAKTDRELIAGVPPVDFYVYRRIPFEEVLPWEIVDAGIDRKLLMREAQRAYEL